MVRLLSFESNDIWLQASSEYDTYSRSFTSAKRSNSVKLKVRIWASISTFAFENSRIRSVSKRSRPQSWNDAMKIFPGGFSVSVISTALSRKVSAAGVPHCGIGCGGRMSALFVHVHVRGIIRTEEGISIWRGSIVQAQNAASSLASSWDIYWYAERRLISYVVCNTVYQTCGDMFLI